jgi:hypothetical protein
MLYISNIVIVFSVRELLDYMYVPTCIEVNNCHLSYFSSSDNVCPTNQHVLRLCSHRLTRVMAVIYSTGNYLHTTSFRLYRRDTPLVIVLHYVFSEPRKNYR